MDNDTYNNQTDNTTEFWIAYDNSPEILFSTFVTILVITALIAMMVNVVVFVSVYWIRRPMPPILKISISLAAADALSSLLFAATLCIYLPIIDINSRWIQLFMEMTKLSGILITVTHLLALSINHYIGILKPLHYNSIVTRRKVTGIIVLLWIFPTMFTISLFVSQSEDDYWTETFANIQTNRTTFTDTFRLRMSYSSFFIVAIVLMAVCYIHILVIVRRQQNIWKNLSRVGSTKWTGRTIKGCHSSKAKEQKQLEGNIRAIYTTLLILGSCIIGWLPALLMFVLICKEDCYIHGEELENLNKTYLKEVLSMRWLENMLVVFKMLANPIIYSIRMKEIQAGFHCVAAILAAISIHIDNSYYEVNDLHETWNHLGTIRWFVVRSTFAVAIFMYLIYLTSIPENLNPMANAPVIMERHEGTKHMRSALSRIFCPSRPDSRNYTLASRRSLNNPNSNNSLLRGTRVRTSINNSGHTSHISIGRSELVNTLL